LLKNLDIPCSFWLVLADFDRINNYLDIGTIESVSFVINVWNSLPCDAVFPVSFRS